MIEDREIILAALRYRRDLVCIALNATSTYPPLRIELARINAEIARRVWNRIVIHAAKSHSPLS